MRIAMGVEYAGEAYHGFQYQENLPTVQAHLESALTQIADHPVRVICAGRTDAGVHATEQVIHFDSAAVRSMRAWVLGANRYVPRDITFRWAKEMPDDFHARFSAVKRRYYYVIYNDWTRPGILNHKVTWHCRPLSLELMQKAAQCLVGTHDFSSFRAAECQAKHPVRTIHDLELFRKNDFIVMTVEADSFLHHMVRNIVGVLLAIGEGSQPVSWVETILEARNRAVGGVTALPDGLYLHQITYPEKFVFPLAAPFFWL